MQRILLFFFLFLSFFQSLIAQPDLVPHTNLIQLYQQHIHLLASDSLEGRESGTAGEKKAGDYIIRQFKNIGLQPKGDSNTYFQTFTFTAGKEYGENNLLKIFCADKTLEFNKAGEVHYPLEYSGNGRAEGKLIFVGFGITATAVNHDDYKNLTGLDGNIFLMELSSPDGMHPHSRYADHSDLRSKIDLAISKGAKGIIFINSDSILEDPKERHFNHKIAPSKIPIIFLKKENWEEIKTHTGISQHSPLPGNIIGNVEIAVDLQPITKAANNIIGFLDNGVAQTVVIGAHYDHLGYGEYGSLHQGEAAIHNGADDNASGTAELIELARELKNFSEKNNNYLIIAFSGEELGLYGSNHFVKHPVIPLERVNYMLNLDMVGRFDQDKGLAVNGTGTSPLWKEIINKITTDSLKIKTSESGLGPSDHASFYLQNIPVLHFFTGTHQDYHKPTDDVDKINFKGMSGVHRFIMLLIDSLNEKGKLVFSKTKDDTNENTPKFTVTLGIIPDYLYEEEGVKIEGIAENKPAFKAGILKGDIIIQIGEHKVVDMMSYMKALSKYKKGESATVKSKRGDKILDFNVTF